MKYLHVIATLFFVTTHHVYALNPVQEWYGGVILGGNYTPSISLNDHSPITEKTIPATLSFSNLGNIGGEVGYRIDNLRLEGEFIYNNSPYNGLTIGNYFINSSGSSTTGLQLQGATNTYALLFNGFYDLFTLEDAENIVPYFGLGIGAALVQNTIQFDFNGTPLYRTERTVNNYTMVGQAILGVSYFLDDFTAFGLDVRYLTSTNAVLKGYVHTTSYRPQLVTINLLFNGSFNLG